MIEILIFITNNYFLQENYSNKIIKPSGSIFGIDLDIYESVEDENVIPESNGLKVIFSNAMLTHCKKRLSKDKEAMAELNKIRGMKPSQIKALQKNKPATVKEETNDGKFKLFIYFLQKILKSLKPKEENL